MDTDKDIIPKIDAAELKQFVDQQQGKIVLIDFWATWCPPCVRLFPHTVELHKKWSADGLAVAAVSLDNPDEASLVMRFLEAKGADFPNFISRYGPGGQSSEEFNIVGGGIPFLQIYNRQGKLIKTLGGDRPIDPLEIDQAVQDALKGE
jgi:thiol-disulfide isomerase/thioredoxin